jgi:hypothetical protein
VELVEELIPWIRREESRNPVQSEQMRDNATPIQKGLQRSGPILDELVRESQCEWQCIQITARKIASSLFRVGVKNANREKSK